MSAHWPTRYKSNAKAPNNGTIMAGTPIKNLFPHGVCGAKNRRGLPCKIRLAVFKCKNGALRCRFHGALSTGPKTEEGKRKVTENLRRWRERGRRRSKHGQPPSSYIT